MPLIRRCAVVALVAATLAGSPALGGTAHAAGSYTCFAGSLTPQADGSHISANPCDGWGGVDVVVVLQFGPYAGTYRCGSAFSWNGYLGADGCSPAPTP
ncbi:hypothetical protein [Nonomuraea sp. NPDC050783]|uniref:hypothetical protein n=1 Tax=Nonomuraea sp. NPDC050783 TaxID=3154634 RepID=UPI0034668AE9